MLTVGLLMVSCAAAIVPFLWEVCDRGSARSRLQPIARHTATGAAPAHADLVTFLTAIARSVRAGESAAGAIISAPVTCPQIADVRRLLVSGVPVSRATSGDHPHVRVLRACMHGDSLSTVALDRAVSDERFRMHAQRDVSLAVAQAGRSARVLTVLPFAFLLFLAGTSAWLRSHFFSPLILGAVTIGIALNIAGRQWVRRLVARAVTPSPELELNATIASTIALHLCAGGSVTDGFGALSPLDPRCADVHSGLRAGHMLHEALAPIGSVAPAVVRTVIDAHRDGLPVNDSIMRLADDLRAASAAHIQSRIAQVGVRSTTPLVLCTLPSFLLIGIAPLALAALSGLSTPSL